MKHQFNLPCWICMKVNSLGSTFRCLWMKPFSQNKWRILLEVRKLKMCWKKQLWRFANSLRSCLVDRSWATDDIHSTELTFYTISPNLLCRDFPKVFPIVLMNFCLEMTAVVSSMTPVVVLGSSQFTPLFAGKPRIFDTLISLFEV